MSASTSKPSVESGGPLTRQIPKGRRWNRRAAILAWVLYLVSLGLPSYSDVRGYGCALAHGLFWQDALDGQWLSILYILLTSSNILMLASPFLLMRLRFADDDRPLIRLRWATVVGALLPSSFLGALLVTEGLNHLQVGAFVWAASFIVLHFATRASPCRTATP